MDLNTEIEQLKKEIKEAMTNQQYWKIQYSEKTRKLKQLEGLISVEQEPETNDDAE